MSPSTPWLIIPKPVPQTNLRLFCFHYAGAGASVFRTWFTQFPPGIELCAVQLPGRENRFKEPLYTNLSSLAESLYHQLLPWLDRPFACFGHSLGALVSFEFARQLRRQHASEPLCLFVSGRQAPQSKTSLARLPDLDLSDDNLLTWLKWVGGTPQAILNDPELRALFFPILRADLTLIQTYQYIKEPPLNCPITVFGGLQDPSTNREELDAWKTQTKNNFSVKLFPGDHFFLQTQRSALIESIVQGLPE